MKGYIMNQYVSTRGRSLSVPSHKAVIKGLAPDGGLFTPLDLSIHCDPATLLGKSYPQTAETILHLFMNDYSKEQLHAAVTAAYGKGGQAGANFDTPDVVPVVPYRDGYLAQLWHGPTSAFKDLALTLLPHLMTQAFEMDGLDVTIAILTATSGDTGKAALAGFKDVAHTDITVFYPEVGVSGVQKRQMQTAGGDNVHVCAVKGTFDDCQRMVKEAVSSPQVAAALDGVILSSANSINLGRLLPQVVYYYFAYCRLVEDGAVKVGEPVNFVVPTGNFGDILAGYLAKQLGLPVGKLICASNSNNVLTDFLKTGTYNARRPFHTTMSPSMDILVSSNLERLLFLKSGGDDGLVRDLMKQLSEKGGYTVSGSLLASIQQDFAGFWTSENQCQMTIHDMYMENGQLIDPHTAVAVAALDQYRQTSGDTRPAVVLSTASPYKFCTSVLTALTGKAPDDEFTAMKELNQLTEVPVPPGLANLLDLPVRFTESIEPEDGMAYIASSMKKLSARNK